MKIVSIKFLNLNSLKGEHQIRFDKAPFTDSGLFAIIGPTGAGKTTILDAITIALYGSVHRHDKEDPSEIMTRHTAESYSEVEFEVKDVVYRAKWSNYRARRKADGKLQGVRMELAMAATGDMIVTHPLPEVQRKIIEVCGLDYNQFIRSVMLSQGDFTRFLRANENDRSDLLEKITDTSIYSEISTWVFKEARNKNNHLAGLQARLDHVSLLTEEELAAHHTKLSDTGHQAMLRRKERDEAILIQQWLLRIESLGKRLQQLQQEYDVFTARYETNKPLFDQLARHQQAMKHQQLFSQVQTGYKLVADTNKKLADIAFTLPRLQQRLDEIYALIEEATGLSETARLAQQEAIPVIAEVEIKDVLIESTAGQCRKEQQVFEEAQASLLQTEQQTLEHEAVLKKLKKEVEELNQWLTAHHHEDELQKAIPVLGNYLERLHKLHQINQRLTQEQLQHREREKQIKNTLLAYQDDAANHQRQLASTAEQLHKSREELQTVLAGRKLEEWETEAADFPLLISICQEQHGLAERIREQEKKSAQTLEKERLYTEQYATESGLLNRLKEDFADAESHAAALQKNVELQILIQKYEGDRKSLQEGKECPLCGSVHHPYVEHAHTHERNEAEQKRDAQQHKVTALSKSASAKELLVRSLQTDLEYTRQQKEQIALEQAAARKKFDENNGLLPRPLQLDKANIIELVIIKKKEEYEKLRQVILYIRTLENTIREQELMQSRLTEKEIRINAGIQDAATKLEHIASSVRRIEQELADAVQVENEVSGKAALLLHPYHISFEYAGGQKTLQQLQQRSSLFMETQARLQQQQIKTGKAQSDVAHATESIADKTQYVQRLESQLAINRKRLQQLQDERYELFGDKEPFQERKRLEKDVAATKETLRALTTELSEINKEVSIAESQQTLWTTEYRKHEQATKELREALTAQLHADNIASIEVLHELFLPGTEAEEIEKLYRQLEKEKTDLQRSLHDNESELRTETGKQLSDQPINILTARIAQLEDTISAFNRDIGSITEILKADERHRAQHHDIAIEIGIQQKVCERWNKLSDLIGSDNGKRFSRFAQGLTLARLTELANRHLLRFSDRYRILKSRDKDLELMIIDGYQADVVRPMATLSGGESFLVSLALALGLSDLASRKVQINSLFIDEGFGTLDAETLDIAISALENLQANGKTIGVISHVEALKERIGTQIQLSQQPGGSSRIRIVSYGVEHKQMG